VNNIALTVALATAPSTAFAELRERPRFWFPLLVVVFSTVAVLYWYYSVVDIEWLKELVFSNSDLQILPPDQRAEAMAMLDRNTMLWGSVAGSIFDTAIVFLSSASCFLLAAKLTRLPQGFKHWFAFSCWTAMPMLLSAVVAAIMLITSDSPQVSPSVVQPLSINELLHRPMGSPGQSLLESLSIPSLLSWILMILGVRVWSQRSWAFSTAFVLLPIACIYGIWAFLAFG